MPWIISAVCNCEMSTDFLRDLHLWNLHNMVIDRLLNTLQLWNLDGLLNSLSGSWEEICLGTPTGDVIDLGNLDVAASIASDATLFISWVLLNVHRRCDRSLFAH